MFFLCERRWLILPVSLYGSGDKSTGRPVKEALWVKQKGQPAFSPSPDWSERRQPPVQRVPPNERWVPQLYGGYCCCMPSVHFRIDFVVQEEAGNTAWNWMCSRKAFSLWFCPKTENNEWAVTSAWSNSSWCELGRNVPAHFEASRSNAVIISVDSLTF